MNIDIIENGYVIDHIQAGKAMEIYNLLELSKLDCEVALITNAKSKKMGKKDLIKIGKLIDLDFEKLAFIDPDLTVNTVKERKIIQKQKLELPEKLVNVATCKNPRCITSIERDLDQVFLLTNRKKKIYRCVYCETSLETK